MERCDWLGELSKLEQRVKSHKLLRARTKIQYSIPVKNHNTIWWDSTCHTLGLRGAMFELPGSYQTLHEIGGLSEAGERNKEVWGFVTSAWEGWEFCARPS